jgi:anti-sigma factor RsiW
VTACKDFDLLLTLHATGALEPAEASRLEAHLAGCAACRAEAARDAEVLALAKLPPPSDAERRAVADRELPRRAASALHRADHRRAGWKRAAVGIAIAAAALFAVLSPGVLRRPSQVPAVPPTQVPAAALAWQEPDLDTLWSDSAVLDFGAAASGADGDATDLTLAALDF